MPTSRPPLPGPGRLARFIRRRELVLAAFIVFLVVVVSLRRPSFLGFNNLNNILLDISILVMLALAQGMIIITRGIDLSVASSLALVAMLVSFVVRAFPFTPVLLLVLLGVVLGGQTGQLYSAHERRFQHGISEFNSHLAVHCDQVLASGTNFHALIHAQPPHLTYLSHVPRYQDETYLNHHLLRWQPETIVQLPEGIGFIPFRLPGSAQLMAANVAALRAHRIVVWAKHGVMARSDVSVKRAADRIEYAETGAKYEYLNLMAGEVGQGLSPDEIRAICQAFEIKQTVF